jgi:hypothetical protein
LRGSGIYIYWVLIFFKSNILIYLYTHPLVNINIIHIYFDIIFIISSFMTLKYNICTFYIIYHKITIKIKWSIQNGWNQYFYIQVKLPFLNGMVLIKKNPLFRFSNHWTTSLCHNKENHRNINCSATVALFTPRGSLSSSSPVPFSNISRDQKYQRERGINSVNLIVCHCDIKSQKLH